MFYSRLKGMRDETAREAVAASLEDVELSAAANKRVSELSGGMRRRLSIAIALLGSPEMCVFDEPTTGLDPLTRRQLWDVLQNAITKNTTMIVTTHSMEEADVLSSRIGIMTRGRLAVIGSNARLKARFGNGFRIKIVFASDDGDKAAAYLKTLLPSAELEEGTPSEHTYRVSNEAVYKGSTLSSFFDSITSPTAKENGILQWSFSSSTLLEVFLAIASADEAAQTQEAAKK